MPTSKYARTRAADLVDEARHLQRAGEEAVPDVLDRQGHAVLLGRRQQRAQPGLTGAIEASRICLDDQLVVTPTPLELKRFG